MYNLNRVTLVGRVGQDPEIRDLENNVSVGRFSIAISEGYMDRTTGTWKETPTEWHNIVVWRKLAERARNELKKGKLVYVEGKLSSRKWEDKDGKEMRTIDIVARDFRAFETPQASGNRGGGSSSFPSAADEPYRNKTTAAPVANKPNTSAPVAPAPKVDSKFEDQPDDDLPF